MPQPILPRSPLPDENWPHWLRQLLASAAVSPATTTIPTAEPQLQSLGKPLSEMLNTVFTHAEGNGVPQRIRLTNVGPGPAHEIAFHGVRADAPVFSATPAQVDELITNGTLNLLQPPQRAVQSLRAHIAKLLDAGSR